jgi:hypothetical protein
LFSFLVSLGESFGFCGNRSMNGDFLVRGDVPR